MLRLLLASILVSLAFLSGCVPLGGCGGFQGGGDQVYARGQDQLILCENGVFVVDSAQYGTIEGRYTWSDAADDNAVATTGTTGALAFDFYNNGDGTASTPQLGDNPWTTVDLDQTALDHADTACQTLETRSWWNTPST